MEMTKAVNKYQSILVIVVGMLVLYFIFEAPVFLYVSGVVGILSLISSTIMDGILWLWFKIAQILGWINSRILLGLVFFLLLFPLALLFRLFNKNALYLNRQEGSVFRVRNHKYVKKDLENIW